ncbi:hypothetical protein [Haloarcula laminariae]|uniref:hypothetical protein n=1 Tax=Haloarcula laminariae TaxID=2961577 RepID=UPI0021C90B0A|nr:hypothetical protein [Halomicroarcula laminariae]
MSESEDSGPGRREVAHRLFAAEFEDSEFSYSESDEERAPNYVVTPTGARVNRLFVVGVLTELEQVNDDVLRARIVDPTGAFVVYAGQYQPEALAFLEAATPPLFVAVTGKARTFEPEDGDRVFTSVRPESISEVDAETRDRWVVQATEQTVARVGRLASARQSGLSGDALQQALVAAGVAESDAAGATLALDYYDTTGDYLRAVRELALNAARVVAGERDEAGSLSLSPGDGTDETLAALATMDLDAPSADPSEETDDVVPSEASDEPEPSEEPDEAEAPTTEHDEAPATDDAGGESAVSETADADSTAEPTTEPPSESSSDPVETAPATSDADELPESTEPAAADSTASGDEPTTEPTASASASAGEPGSPSTDDTESGGSLGDFEPSDDATDADGTEDDDVGEFDPEFELDEDEREEIEEEYGTAFQSGTEVDDAGEAGIETPDPEELAEAEAASGAEPEAASGADEVGEPATDAGAAGDGSEADSAAEPAEDVDLEDAVMDVMTDLNDGSGADREAVITEVVETYGADRAAVEDAVQDALMGGRCYEPDDGKLTPI